MVAVVEAVTVVMGVVGAAVLGGDGTGFGNGEVVNEEEGGAEVLVSGLLKVKEEDVIGRNVEVAAGEEGTDVIAGIDFAGEGGAVDVVGDLAAVIVVMPGNNALVGGGGDVTAGGGGRTVGRG